MADEIEAVASIPLDASPAQEKRRLFPIKDEKLIVVEGKVFRERNDTDEELQARLTEIKIEQARLTEEEEIIIAMLK